MRLTCLILLAAACVGLAAGAARADDISGKMIYHQNCSRCHGTHGQGTTKHPDPLVGEKSPAQLAAVISRTMPDDDPDKCSAEDAKKVSAFIYDTFYSADARARLDPPRVELAHLTVRQYRNSIADVIGSFRQPGKLDSQHGLRGEYFASRNMQEDKRVITRIDPEVKFDFGTRAPDGSGTDVTNDAGKIAQNDKGAKENAKAGAADKAGDGDAQKGVGKTKDDAKDKEKSNKPSQGSSRFNPNQFCMRWDGSVTAPETGTYDFVVRTEQALRLWVNDTKTPLIDAAVKSGNDSEYRGSIMLLGGRSYSIRLEVTKGKELKDKKLASAKPTKASVELLWKRPRGADEVIPATALSPVKSPEVAVMATPFPPDDRSFGWERGTIVSKEWVGATTDAALEAAGYIIPRLPELAGVSEKDSDRAGKLRTFSRKFAEAAFRRPLSDQEKQIYIDRQFDAAGNPELAVKRVVLLVLTSPRFLYPGAGEEADGYAAACRLAETLWDSTPDQALLQAAAEHKLSKPQEIRSQAERMMADPRAKAKVRDFLLAWLKVEQPPEIAKDPKRFPDFNPAIAGDLRTSLELFLDDIVWSDKSDFRQLFLSNEYFINGRLAKFYGVNLPPDAGFRKMKLNDGDRAGVLTHPYLLSVLAYPAGSSPIHRGVFLARGILGITLRPPPNAFVPLPAESHPDFTTRERVAFQTRSEACVRCHGVINPLGFTLENFDAVGRHRDKENGKTIDASGFYGSRAGIDEKFAGPRQLASYLAGSEEVQGAFAQQMFHHFVKQPVRAYGLDEPTKLQKAFADSGYNVRKLVIEIAVTAAQQSEAPVARKAG